MSKECFDTLDNRVEEGCPVGSLWSRSARDVDHLRPTATIALGLRVGGSSSLSGGGSRRAAPEACDISPEAVVPAAESPAAIARAKSAEVVAKSAAAVDSAPVRAAASLVNFALRPSSCTTRSFVPMVDADACLPVTGAARPAVPIWFAGSQILAMCPRRWPRTGVWHRRRASRDHWTARAANPSL